eukprot:1181528-Prymnesium_polylepis.1
MAVRSVSRSVGNTVAMPGPHPASGLAESAVWRDAHERVQCHVPRVESHHVWCALTSIQTCGCAKLRTVAVVGLGNSSSIETGGRNPQIVPPGSLQRSRGNLPFGALFFSLSVAARFTCLLGDREGTASVPPIYSGVQYLGYS